jgi:hypothetical protein
MQVLARAAGAHEAEREGGADSNLIYKGKDPEIRKRCESLGIGISTPDSCFIEACAAGGVSKETLTRLRAIVRTKFLDWKYQVLPLMKEFEIPATLKVFSSTKRNKQDRPVSETVRLAKDCPGGNATFGIVLYLGHYFKGNFDDVCFIDDLLKAGELSVRSVADMPKQNIEIPENLDPADFDPDWDVRAFSPLAPTLKDKEIYQNFEFKEQHIGPAKLDRKAIYANYVEFHDRCMEDVPHYRGVIKAFSKLKQKGHNALRLADVGRHEGSVIYVDINQSYPDALLHTPIPVGVPRVVQTADGPDYEFDTLPVPQSMFDFFDEREAEKCAAKARDDPPAVAIAKTKENSVPGYLNKNPRKHVMRKLTPENLAYDAPLLQRTDEERGVYWISNVLDMSGNYAPWVRGIYKYGRDHVQALMDRAEQAGFHVIYCHTDGFWVPAEAEPLYDDALGDERGQVKIERRAEHGVLVKNKNEAIPF